MNKKEDGITGKEMQKKSPFHDAIKKYGKDNFKYEILHSGIETQEILDNLEMLEIKNRNTIVPNGYNLMPGGFGSRHNELSIKKMRAIWADENYRKSMIEKMKKAANNPQIIQRLRDNAIRNAKDENIRNEKSKKLKIAFSSEEVRKERSNKRKKEWEDPEIRKKRIEGMAIARSTDKYKIRKKEIMEERWKDENYRNLIIEKNKGKKMPAWFSEFISKKRMVKVICIETGEIFDSVGIAAEKYNISRSCISCVLSGRQKTAAGMHWEKYNGASEIPETRS